MRVQVPPSAPLIEFKLKIACTQAGAAIAPFSFFVSAMKLATQGIQPSGVLVRNAVCTCEWKWRVTALARGVTFRSEVSQFATFSLSSLRQYLTVDTLVALNGILFRMRFVFLILISCLLGMFLFSAKPAEIAQPSASAPPWQEGERLIYSASWADVLAAAEIKFEATGRRLIAGRETRRVSVRARTVGLVDKLLFRVDDLYESFLDPVSSLPLHCENIWRHGKKSEASSYELDHAGRTATLSGGRVLKIPADTYDLAGLAYAVRTIDQERRKSTRLTLLDEERLHPLVFQVEGKESLATPAGEFVAARIAIKLPDEEEGEDHYKLRLFISADSRRFPLRLTAEPGWGSVRMELVTFEGARPAR